MTFEPRRGKPKYHSSIAGLAGSQKEMDTSNPATKATAQILENQRTLTRRLIRICIDSSFPYVLVFGTLAAIVSLASVWIFTALSFAPVVGA
jgi:hypothetical protein